MTLDLIYRIGQIVCSNVPVRDTYLYSKLGVEFIHLDKKTIHDTVEGMVKDGRLVKVSFISDVGDGTLYFPPKTMFEFGGFTFPIGVDDSEVKKDQ